MTQVNTLTVVDRHNRPTVTQAVLLRMFFVNDGIYTDPLGISAVDIFTNADNTSPGSVLTSANLPTGTPLFRFENSSVDVTNSSFNPIWYSGTAPTTAERHTSGIYKLGTGQYGVILNGGIALSGGYEGSAIENFATC